MQLIRKTKSVCPKCIKKIKADIVEESEKVYMIKKCPKHGKFKILLSNNFDSYSEMDRLYQLCKTNNPKTEKKYFLLYLTTRCNLNCPICFIDTNNADYQSPSLEYIQNIVKRKKNCVFNLFGGEPTLRNDLPEVIKIIKSSKNELLLYTNGIKISDYFYLKKLLDSGLGQVHLQLDGFDEEVFRKLRGENLIKFKKKALENLKKLNLPTVLEVTVAKGINENEVNHILNYSLKNHFIKGIVFRSFGAVGKGKLKKDYRISNDELLDIIETQTKGIITKKEVYSFQKLIYLVTYIFRLKNFQCFYNNYFLILRDKNFKNILKTKFKSNLHRRKRLNRITALLYLFSFLFKSFKFNVSALAIGFEIITKSFFGLPIKVLNKNTSAKFLFLEFAGMCDPYMFDFNRIDQCPGKPLIPGKNYSSFAMHNLTLSK